MKIALSASLSACVLVLALATPSSAQTVTGAIMGTVTDDSGGIVPGATVTVVNTGTNFNRSHVTDEKGHYEVRQRDARAPGAVRREVRLLAQAPRGSDRRPSVSPILAALETHGPRASTRER